MSPRPIPEAVPGASVPLPQPIPLRGVPPTGSGPAPEPEAPELWLALHLPQAPTPEGLETLALRAQRFTPRVCLAPPDGLLLEIKGSLHLFGGLTSLLQSVTHELAASHQGATLAAAPVPRAALVAARAGKPLQITSLARLVGSLSSLPLTALRWPDDLLERLASIGVRSLGQALRLPRAGFARRFGMTALNELEQLTARAPDLWERHEEPASFQRKRHFLHEIEHHTHLVTALAPLLADLGRFLERHQLALLDLTCLLWHREGPPTVCELRLAAPEGRSSRLSELLAERLNTLMLTQPVRSGELRAGALVPRTQRSASLWQPGEHGGEGAADATGLIERLRTRLGPTAVYGLALHQSHRPESAWRATEPSELVQDHSTQAPRIRPNPLRPPWPAGRRPVWLLRPPQRLPEQDGRPWRHGPLSLLSKSGPERIETAWWDGGEVRRDYYIARDPRGIRLWIFREQGSWYLHGLFA